MQEDQFDPDVKDQYFAVMACVEQVCIDLDLPVSHFGNRFLSWALRGLVEVKLDVSNEVKEVRLPISDVCTCQLPGDYVDWCIVGIPFGQYIKTLSYNERLSIIPRTTENWNPSESFPPGWLPDGVGVETYGGFQFSNHGGRALLAFGTGLPHRGHYKIANGQIFLDAGIPASEISLVYIGLGISCCGETILHPYYYEYTRQYMHFQWAQWGKRLDRSEAEIQRLGREVWHQEQKVRGRVFQITPTDLLTTARKSYRLTNKA